MADSSLLAEPVDQRARPRWRIALSLPAVLWCTVSVFILSALLEPASVSGSSLNSMLPFAGILALAAIGQTLVVMARGIDLSVAGTMTLAALVGSKVASDHGSVLIGIAAVLGVTTLIGLLNGFIVSVLNVTPLVTTFAMSVVLSGAALTYSGGTPVRAPRSLADFCLSKTAGISNSLLVGAVLVVIASVLTTRTVWGRQLQAVGASERAAIASGIPATRLKVSSYVAAAWCYGAAGILLAGYVSTPNVTSGNRYLLPSIAAVVVGGTAFGGGRGNVFGTALGALFLSQLSQLVLSLGIPTSTQMLMEAAVLAIAVGAQGPVQQRVAHHFARYRRQPRAPRVRPSSRLRTDS